MKIFAIGDPHLSFDPRVEKPMDVFGGGWIGHTEKLYNDWLEKVKPEDIVIVAGDISWGLRQDEAEADLNWLHALPGKKLIFKGNHDLWWQSVSKLRKLYDTDDMVFMQHSCFAADSENKLFICGTRGWICPGTEGFGSHDRTIYEREVLRLEMSLDEAMENGAEKVICVLHYPPTNDSHQSSGFTELMERYPVKRCVYGHIHGKDNFKRGISGVFNGIEYKLVSLDYLQGKLYEIEM